MRKPQRGSDRSLLARQAAVEMGTFRVSNSCAMEEIWRPWQICVTADQPGELGFRRRYIRTSDVELHWDVFDSPCRLRGLSPPDSLVVLVPLRFGPRSRYWHNPAGRDQLYAMHPGGIDWMVDSGHSHLMVLVKYAMLHCRCAEEFCAALEGPAGTHCVPAKPGEVQRLGEWLSKLVSDPDQRPEMLLCPEAPEDLAEQLLQRLEQTIDLTRAARLQPAGCARRRGLELALAYLSAADLPAVAVTHLTAVAGVSRRTLEHAFRDTFDLPPSGFLRLLRLHAARRALTASEPHATTVASVADRNGFAQHGRFSVAYRQLFGESPSETLRRPTRQVTAGRSPSPESRQMASTANCHKPVWTFQTLTKPVEDR